MGARKLEVGPLLVGIGGIVLFASLFLDWYQPGMTAWTAFEALDLVLAGLALMAAWTVVSHLLFDAPLREGVLPIVAGVAFVVVASQIVNHPPAAQGGRPQVGAWVGLAGAGVMAAGAALGATRISFSLPTPSRAERPEPRRRATPENEAAAVEPEVHEELYPEQRRQGPIGADDPELWSERT
jgi:hypothetical protein